MAIDWKQAEFVNLAQKLRAGKVFLFAGAGFSLGAKNELGNPLPLGNTLAQLIAQEAGSTYNNEPLPLVYEALEPRIGTNKLWEFLRKQYTVESAANWYRTVMSITWYRVYTTNIDTLFQFIAPFPSGQKLTTYVKGDYPDERDPFLDKLQCIHLHGHVDHKMNGVSFTPLDFAQHTARPDPWYQQLVTDLHDTSAIFVGTQLEEPILNHYLELRDPKPGGQGEWRPRSFLVTPHISEIKKAALLTRNIYPVEMTAEDFFTSLAANIDLATLSTPAVRATAWPQHFGEAQKFSDAVLRDFDAVVPGQLTKKAPPTSRFFLGTEPTWDDIEKQRDAGRDVNNDLLDILKRPVNKFAVSILHGPAGSGKTTCAMRVAYILSQQGYQVFFAKGLQRIDWDGILKIAEALKDPEKERVFVFVDVVSRHLGSVDHIRKRLSDAKALTLIGIDRTNAYASRCQALAKFDPEEVKMPHLSQNDVEAVLDRLTEFGFLGVLRNKSRAEQIALFMERASRQMLVALKEATSGRDFDSILRDEFNELAPEAKLAYTICCIAVSQGAPGVYLKHLMPCLPKSRFAKGVIINDLLRDILVPANDTGSLLQPRHRLIAKWVAEDVSPIDLRLEAINSFLAQVSAHIVPTEITKRTAPYLAYRGMVSCDGLYNLLGGDAPTVLELYEDVRPLFDKDFLFWLQFGMAHIRANNLDIAENFLHQSLNLYPRSHQTQHHLAVLYLIQACNSQNPAAAIAKAEEAMEMLRQQIRERGDNDSYPYHAYLTHVSRWYSHAKELITQKEWEALRKVGDEARAKYKIDDGIRDAANEVETRYLKKVVNNPA